MRQQLQQQRVVKVNQEIIIQFQPGQEQDFMQILVGQVQAEHQSYFSRLNQMLSFIEQTQALLVLQVQALQRHRQLTELLVQHQWSLLPAGLPQQRQLKECFRQFEQEDLPMLDWLRPKEQKSKQSRQLLVVLCQVMLEPKLLATGRDPQGQLAIISKLIIPCLIFTD